MIKYCIKEGIKNVFSNFVMSIASISVMVCCMVLTGSAILVSVNLSCMLKNVENQNSITVFLKKNVTNSKVSEIESQIKKVPNVLKCEYYSSNQASEKYRDVLGGLYGILQKGGSLFPESFHVTMENLSMYKETVENIEKISGVDSVSDRSETAKKLSELSQLVYTSGLWIVASLGVISLFIIINTIGLTIYSRRKEISIMKSVGATNAFIRTPFLVEGIIIGLLSSLASSGILAVAYNSFSNAIGGIISFQVIYFKDIFYTVLLWFLTSGLFMGIVGSLISIHRYLKKEGVDFAE